MVDDATDMSQWKIDKAASAVNWMMDSKKNIYVLRQADKPFENSITKEQEEILKEIEKHKEKSSVPLISVAGFTHSEYGEVICYNAHGKLKDKIIKEIEQKCEYRAEKAGYSGRHKIKEFVIEQLPWVYEPSKDKVIIPTNDLPQEDMKMLVILQDLDRTSVGLPASFNSIGSEVVAGTIKESIKEKLQKERNEAQELERQNVIAEQNEKLIRLSERDVFIGKNSSGNEKPSDQAGELLAFPKGGRAGSKNKE